MREMAPIDSASPKIRFGETLDTIPRDGTAGSVLFLFFVLQSEQFQPKCRSPPYLSESTQTDC